MTFEMELRQTLLNLLTSSNIPSGTVIAWGHGNINELREVSDPGLRLFTLGLEAWFSENYIDAAKAWRSCRRQGLTGYILDELIRLAETSIEHFIQVYVDGSYSPFDRNGGVACVYEIDDYIGMLVKFLPGPLPDNHFAEAEALKLALTARELADLPLIVYTDSEALLYALQNPENNSLPTQTSSLISEIGKIRTKRSVDIQFLHSRRGHMLHDKADKLSKWVRTCGGSDMKEETV